jgi:hypothetical protein
MLETRISDEEGYHMFFKANGAIAIDKYSKIRVFFSQHVVYFWINADLMPSSMFGVL